MKELEEQLQLAKDRIFVSNYYKYEAENHDLKYRIKEQEDEILALRNIINKKVKFNPTLTLYETQKQQVLNTLSYFKGNKTQAANALGITIKTLYNKLYEYGELK